VHNFQFSGWQWLRNFIFGGFQISGFLIRSIQSINGHLSWDHYGSKCDGCIYNDMKCRVTVSDRNNNGNKNEIQEINQLIHYTKNRKKSLLEQMLTWWEQGTLPFTQNECEAMACVSPFCPKLTCCKTFVHLSLYFLKLLSISAGNQDLEDFGNLYWHWLLQSMPTTFFSSGTFS
jgi:hypothetical protein